MHRITSEHIFCPSRKVQLQLFVLTEGIPLMSISSTPLSLVLKLSLDLLEQLGQAVVLHLMLRHHAPVLVVHLCWSCVVEVVSDGTIEGARSGLWLDCDQEGFPMSSARSCTGQGVDRREEVGVAVACAA